jgi:RHS repeat-associated protein
MPLRFPGQWADEETGQTGLYYNWWRYYEPTLGAYAAEDPLRRVAPHAPYQYVLGAPTTAIDPLGLERWDWDPAFKDKDITPDPYTKQLVKNFVGGFAENVTVVGSVATIALGLAGISLADTFGYQDDGRAYSAGQLTAILLTNLSAGVKWVTKLVRRCL